MLVLSLFWRKQYRIWLYLRAFCGKPSNKSQDKVRIILRIIQNTKQEYSTFLSCQSTFKIQKAKKMNSTDFITTINEFNIPYYHYQWIQLTSSPLSVIVGKTRWRRRPSVLFFRLSVLFFCQWTQKYCFFCILLLKLTYMMDA